MEKKINDGGPAFPLPEERFSGMTLRDYFAAAALQGTLAAGLEMDVDDRAEFSYLQADAMLAARERKDGSNG